MLLAYVCAFCRNGHASSGNDALGDYHWNCRDCVAALPDFDVCWLKKQSKRKRRTSQADNPSFLIYNCLRTIIQQR